MKEPESPNCQICVIFSLRTVEIHLGIFRSIVLPHLYFAARCMNCSYFRFTCFEESWTMMKKLRLRLLDISTLIYTYIQKDRPIHLNYTYIKKQIIETPCAAVVYFHVTEKVVPEEGDNNRFAWSCKCSKAHFLRYHRALRLVDHNL
jgi:hypothetical protein